MNAKALLHLKRQNVAIGIGHQASSHAFVHVARTDVRAKRRNHGQRRGRGCMPLDFDLSELYSLPGTRSPQPCPTCQDEILKKGGPPDRAGWLLGRFC